MGLDGSKGELGRPGDKGEKGEKGPRGEEGGIGPKVYPPTIWWSILCVCLSLQFRLNRCMSF